jgi:hypothetical protein
MEITPALELTIDAYGSWTTPADDGTVIYRSGSPYIIEVRVRGATAPVAITSLTITNEVGSVESVENWEAPAHDPSDSSVVIADRRGVDLSPSTQAVIGQLQIGVGGGARLYDFSGVLEYEYREDKKNRLLQLLRGI